MKAFSSKNSLFNVLVGAILCLVFLTSCQNFLNGGEIKKEIKDAIAYNNAKEITVLIQSEEGTGSTVPAGNHKAKQGYDFEVSFTENPAYCFIKWTAVTNDSSRAAVSEGVIFEDATSPKTKVIIKNDSVSIRIIPLCEERIAVSGEPSPRYDTLGVSRDRSISVSFTKALAPESFIFNSEEIPKDVEESALKKDDDGYIWAYTYEGQTYLKNITITNVDDYSIAEHFTKPLVTGKLLTIGVDRTNPIEFNAGEIFKTVKVTLSGNITDTGNIKMNTTKSWNYQITEKTDEQATVNLTSVAAEGSVYLAGTKEYSLGQKITLAFTENADYQFVKWDYDADIIYIEDPKSINTSAIVREKTTEENPSQIKAVCAPRLRVVENGYEPVTAGNKSVPKNSSIKLRFNQNLPTDTEGIAQLANIGISIGGTPVNTSFITPEISGNTISFVANKTNLLYVTEGQTKTITVTIPADFYYKTTDGTKITYGGKGFSFDYRIDSSTINKASVIFEMENDSGIMTPDVGIQEFSEGQEVNISFIKSDGWKFLGWTIKDSQTNTEIPDSKIEILNKSDNSTKMIVYKAVSNVKVKANAVLLPAVSSFSPSYETLGVDCDTPVVIRFNKTMNTNTFSLYSQTENTGTIHIVSPTNENEHYEEYFDEPQWNGNGTILTLKPKNTIRDGLVINTTDLQNIRIVFKPYKINETTFINPVDQDGYTLENADTGFVYRINHNMETLAPTVIMKLYKPDFELSQNENGKYFAKETGEYIELSDLTFSNFTSNTYPLNHVGKNIYFDAYVFDEGSGYNNLTIKETLIKTTADIDVNAQTYYYETSFTKEIDSFTDEINTASVIRYTLKSTIDGLVRLDFVFEDFAHSSTVVTYYVIKDTQLNENVYQKDAVSQDYTTVSGNQDAIDLDALTPEERKTIIKYGAMYYCYTDTETAAIRRFCNENNEYTEIIKFSKKEEYYKNRSSYAHYNVFWGYDENDICNEAEEFPERTFSFTRNVNNDCFIKITVFDDAGNFFTDTAKIPKQHTVISLKENDFSNNVKYYTPTTTFSSSYSASYIFYRYKENNDSELSEFRRHQMRSGPTGGNTKMGFQFENPLFTDETFTPDGIYYIYDLPYNTSPFGEVAGTMSEPFVLYHNCEGSNSTGAPDFPYDFTCEINPAVPDSTGKRQISVSLPGPDSFTPTQGCHYGVTYGSGENFYDYNFTVTSGTRYNIYLCAIDSEGTFYKSDIYKEVDATYDNIPPDVPEDNVSFCNKDLSAPNEILLSQKIDGNNSGVGHKIYLPRDIGSSGLYENDDGLVEFDYYYIKRDDTEYTLIDLSREDLEGLEKHTVSYSKYAKQIKLDFNEPVESFYVLILDLKDKNTNSALRNCTVSNIIVPFYPDFYLEGSSTSDYSIKIDNLRINQIDYYFDCCTLSNTGWTFKKRYIQGAGKDFCSFNEAVSFVRCALNGPYNSFYTFICPEYFIKQNAGNLTECNSKSVIPGLSNTYQVYYDAPCFAHTMAIKTELLGNLDVKLVEAKALDPTIDDETYIKAIWETKGREYGLKVINSAWLTSASTATYTAPVNEIPSGYSYVTIFHFADGTSVMSEVKQK